MRIGGYQKLTLIDYPGVIATTVFTVGCSFRCPFCHNPELVLRSQFMVNGKQEEEFFAHLAKRQGKLEGVCITGGEPTIQPDIIEFIKKVKAMGFLVKLDTNGTRPDVLKKLLDQKLLDFVAMDIKNQLKNYDKTTGVKGPASTRGNDRSSTRGGDKKRIKLSVGLIMNSELPYEFRTTVVPGIHEEKDFLEIAKWLKGAETYYLQEYREKIILDPKLKKKTKGKTLDLKKIKKSIENNFKKVDIRYNN
ncbi:MAG TPA: anaerobic ribonucleoside-triphosphate reductase activating protein [Candidatus Moranbacteria bacterium]|nr:anaerobic ribonucleoside-triphosphate reductase activating protein [Candidatus Moranbacteria bacterium]HRY28165.1 anaerobic ribonucleoside-triphosphate reductase activating protein [Candidatus Moranbacteria bacterium]HSA08640.1 anaerobic ribonucleoside-triphosphate reductase activating protein [Candidatus Moranbacteria bacterium]